MTYHFNQHEFKGITKSAGGVVARRVEGPYNITVDPVLGDDAEWNDGTITPLKTLEALFQRLPTATHKEPFFGAYGSEPVPGSATVNVLLKAGDYGIPAGVSPYDALTVDFSNVNIYGEKVSLSSFTIDSWTNDNFVIHKPLADPAWVADEHVGHMLELVYSGSPYYYFIIANGTHDLTLALDWNNWPSVAPVGTVVSIHKLGTRWVGPRPIMATANHALGAGGFSFIDFDGTLGPAPYFFDQFEGSLIFSACRMKGSGGVGHFYFSTTDSVKAFQYFYSCMFQNHYPGVDTYNGNIIVQNVIAVNTARMLQTRFLTTIDMRGNLIMRNSNDLVFNMRGCRAFWTYIGYIYCINSGSVWAYVNIVESHLTAEGAGATLIDGQAPSNFFYLSSGNRLLLKYWTIEASTPGNTLIFGGYNPAGAPFKYMSVADLKNIYGNHYDFGWGCEAISFP
jgi:hypothetical protein